MIRTVDDRGDVVLVYDKYAPMNWATLRMNPDDHGVCGMTVDEPWHPGCVKDVNHAGGCER